MRAALAGDAGFGSYLESIRPWLVSQHSVLLSGDMNSSFVESAASGSGKYLLQSIDCRSQPLVNLNDTVVGDFRPLVGQDQLGFKLFRKNSFQALLDASPLADDVELGDLRESIMLIPAPFSPAQ